MPYNEGYQWLDAVALCRAGPGRMPDIASILSLQENGRLTIALLAAIFYNAIDMQVEAIDYDFRWKMLGKETFILVLNL